MTYELAKELMLAGFPAKRANAKNHNDEVFPFPRKGSYYLFPTLSELIEACGNDLADMAQGSWGWDATSYGGEFRCKATTPEEAVARLWLALNKK